MQRAKLDEATYLLLPSRLKMSTPYILPPVKTPPPNTSILGKHGRGSETSSETGDKEEDGGAAFSQAFGLRTDFDIPKQVSFPVCLRTTGNKIVQPMKTDGRAERARTITPLTYIIGSTRTSVQLCHKKQYRTNRSLRPYKRMRVFVCY